MVVELDWMSMEAEHLSCFWKSLLRVAAAV